MQPYPYTPGSLADLLTALSEPRFQTYLDRASGDPELRMRQYVWNAAVASGLHGPLHILEVTLRNAVHDRLWVSSLQPVFLPRPIRHELHEKLDRLRTLRNRIAHHEPILQRHLMADLTDIKEIVGAVSPAVLDWLNWHEQATARFATPAADIDLF